MAPGPEEKPNKDVPIGSMVSSTNPNQPHSKDYFGVGRGMVSSEDKKPSAPIEESGKP